MQVQWLAGLLNLPVWPHAIVRHLGCQVAGVTWPPSLITRARPRALKLWWWHCALVWFCLGMSWDSRWCGRDLFRPVHDPRNIRNFRVRSIKDQIFQLPHGRDHSMSVPIYKTSPKRSISNLVGWLSCSFCHTVLCITLVLQSWAVSHAVGSPGVNSVR